MKRRKPLETTADRRRAANRENAQKSTGPRTPEGKATSSQNAITHGIHVASPVLSTEDQAAFDTTERLLRREFAPRSAAEEWIFQKLIHVSWNQERMRTIEQVQYEITMLHPDLTKGFAFAGPPILAALAHQRLAGTTTILQSLNRQLSRLSREFYRLMNLYRETHGPIVPVAPEKQTEQNEPNLHLTPEHSTECPANTLPITAYFRYAEEPADPNSPLATRHSSPSPAPHTEHIDPGSTLHVARAGGH